MNIMIDLTSNATSPMEIALIALAVAFIAVIIAIVLCVRLRKLHKSIEEQVIDSWSVGKHIEMICKKCIDANGNAQRHLELSTDMYNDIVDNVIRQVERRISKHTIVEQITLPNHHLSIQKQTLYASSYNQSKGTFYEVSSQASEQTIFEIIISPDNPNEGVFEVYSEAYEKVVECKDFLEVCCDVEGNGQDLQTLEKGCVDFGGGMWSVTKKLKVRFS